MSENRDAEGLVDFIVRGLVDDPDAVSVDRVESSGDITFEVTVADDDIGKVIGRQGRIIRAIRVLARASGLLDGKQVRVEVLG